MHTIMFMGDRTQMGEPTPYAIPPDQAKKCGTWTKVKWDNKVDKLMKFFVDEMYSM